MTRNGSINFTTVLQTSPKPLIKAVIDSEEGLCFSLFITFFFTLFINFFVITFFIFTSK